MDLSGLQQYIQMLLPTVKEFGVFIYLLIFFISLLETLLVVGVFIPGLLFFLAAGFFAAQGYMDLYLLIIVAAVGAFSGDFASFTVGKKYGNNFFKEGHFLYGSQYLTRAENFFQKYGRRGIVFSRFITPLRAFVPFIAGTAGVGTKEFILWDIAGGSLWAVLHIGAGYLMGLGYSEFVYWSDKTSFSLLVISVLAFVNIYLLHFLAHRKEAIVRFIRSIFISIEQGLKENEYIKKFNFKYPRLATFIRNRMSPHYYFGLHLTVGFLVITALLYFFAKVVGGIYGPGEILKTDSRIIKIVDIFYNTATTKAMIFLTNLGRWEVIVTISFVLLVGFLIKRRWYAAIALVSSTMIGELFVFFLKNIIKRQRPDEINHLVYQSGYSFPSGHATLAVIFYGLLAYFLIKKIKHWESKVGVFLLSVFLIFFIGLSRVYLGVHYPSDVLAGFLLGFAWLATVIPALEIRNRFFPEVLSIHEDQKPLVGKKTFIFTMIFLAVLELGFIYKLYQITPVFEKAAPVYIEKVSLDEVVPGVDKVFANYPRRAEGLFGKPMSPFAFLIIGREDKLVSAFEKAGWNVAEDITITNTARLYYYLIINKPYPNGQFSPSFFNGNIHDIGFQKFTDVNSPRIRHHTRFWKMPFLTKDGQEIFVATASFDKSFGVFAHDIDPAIDVERDFIKDDLVSTGMVELLDTVQFVRPEMGQNFAGDQFFTDGKLYVMKLK
jgi:undecaprenyl-diphosphatase